MTLQGENIRKEKGLELCNFFAEVNILIVHHTVHIVESKRTLFVLRYGSKYDP